MKNILIFGGTFDPPHHGHLKTAETVCFNFNFDTVLFLPCKSPVLKAESQASPSERIDMLKLALKSYSQFRIDLSEIKRDTPSYMAETLKNLYKIYHGDALTLMLGTDALMQLNKWYRWETLLEYCNILVIKRDIKRHDQLSDELTKYISSNISANKDEFMNTKKGKIFFVDAGKYDISSTNIRNAIKNNQNIKSYLPDGVLQYIQKHELYTRGK